VLTVRNLLEVAVLVWAVVVLVRLGPGSSHRRADAGEARSARRDVAGGRMDA
jgi:hypothetical protein